MEQAGILDIDDAVDMFCLHYVFLPRVNHALAAFKDGWNCHPISTEGNLSPLQLWMSGLAGQQPDLEAQVYKCSCSPSEPLLYSCMSG